MFQIACTRELFFIFLFCGFACSLTNTLGLIVPVTSRYLPLAGEFEHNPLLVYLGDSLKRHVIGRNVYTKLYIGFDEGDNIYDTPIGAQIFDELASRIPMVSISIVRLVKFSGMVAHIWSHLSQIALEDNCDYFAILGDDSLIMTDNWGEILISKLNDNNNLGTAAFHDVNYPFFPTYPFFHKTHLEIFGKCCYDEFTNYFAESWISDVYIKFNSSFVMSDISLTNMIGGAVSAVNRPRYQPVMMDLDQYLSLVEAGRSRVNDWLCSHHHKKCISGGRARKSMSYGPEGLVYDSYCQINKCARLAPQDYAILNSKISRRTFKFIS